MNKQLKELALTAQGEHPNFGDWLSTGVVIAAPADGGMEYLVELCYSRDTPRNKAVLDFIEAANPNNVLALIAENEELKAQLAKYTASP